jgi:hypothetical protein
LGRGRPLETAHTILFVNVAVALLLLPVPQHHSDTKDQDEVDADNAKGGSEDLVQILVGKRGELSNAATLLRGNKGVLAGAVNDEWRRGGVDVAAAVKLDFVSN